MYAIRSYYEDINQKLCLIVQFIEREVHINMPEGEFVSFPDEEVPVQEKVLLVHYLNNLNPLS